MTAVHIADLLLSFGDTTLDDHWPTASWGIDREGVVHSHYKHTHARSHFRNEPLSQLTSSSICNDLECGDAKHFGPDVAALIPQGTKSEDVIASALNHLNASVAEDPRTALRHLRLLQRRLNQETYQDWAHATTVADEVREAISRAVSAIHTDEALDVGEAAKRVLQHVEEGPLHELRSLVHTHVVGDVPICVAVRLHALSCDASAAWEERMDLLIARVVAESAPEGHLLPEYLEPALKREYARGVPKWEANHRVWARDLARIVPQLGPWWSNGYRQLASSPLRALVHLPVDRVQFDTLLPWEAWRAGARSPLLHVPYAIGRLAELVHDAPCLILDRSLTETELGTCSVLVQEQSETVSTQTLTTTVTSAQFLCS